MSDRHARRLIEAAEVAENISASGPIGPVSESQVRELKNLKPEQQRKVWKEASETANTPGKPTAKEVEAVVRRIAPSQSTSRASSPATPEPDSELLSLLKSYWTAATRTERAQFLLWVKQ
jgi:hypothetical protein